MPDFIPAIGLLDDAVIVAVLVYAGLKLIPRELVAEQRKQIFRQTRAT